MECESKRLDDIVYDVIAGRFLETNEIPICPS